MESSYRLDQSIMVFEYVQQRNFHVDMEKSLKGHQDTSWVKGHLLTNMHDSKTNASSTWALMMPADFLSWSALEFQINCKKILDSKCRGTFDVNPWLSKASLFLLVIPSSYFKLCIIKFSRNRYDVSFKLQWFGRKLREWLQFKTVNDLVGLFRHTKTTFKILTKWEFCGFHAAQPTDATDFLMIHYYSNSRDHYL